MTTITADDEVEEVMVRIGVGSGEELRESTKRENTLEKFAQLRSRDPNVSLDIEPRRTSCVEVDDEEEKFKNIIITSRKFEQTITDLSEDYFDYLLQASHTTHEIGHLLYSSWPALKKYQEKVVDDAEERSKWRRHSPMFNNFVNLLEDGAIEKFLGEQFLAEEELLTMRATMHENDNNYMGKEYNVEGEIEYRYPYFFAVMTAALNIGVYDNGELDKLLDEDNPKHVFADTDHDKKMFEDETLPEIRKYISEIQKETDAEARMRLCYELWKTIQDHLDRSTNPGESDFQREQNATEEDSYAPGVPENMSEGHGEEEESVEAPSGDSNDGDSDESLGEKRAETAEKVKQGKTEDIKEKAKEGIAAEASQQDGDWSEELEEIVQSLQGGDGVDEIAIADPQDVRTSRKKQAERHGRRCERMFARQLKELQQDRTLRDKRRGRLDNRKMVDASRGSTRIFEQTAEGDQKNYSCMIIVDRSTSMSDRIEEVEIATGAVAYGLESNGVSTSIVDTFDSMTTLSKPFGSDVEHHTGTIFGNRTRGGTPLRYTMQFARQRMTRGKGDYPFAIVITDGKPNDREKFKKQVRSANFPILGLYLTDKKEHVKKQLELYDKAIAVGQEDDIGSELVNLIRGIIL